MLRNNRRIDLFKIKNTIYFCLGPAKNIGSKRISEEFTLRKNNYDRIQERGEKLHKLIVEENEWLVKAAKENYKRAEIERKIAEEVLRISIAKRKEAEMLLSNKLQE